MNDRPGPRLDLLKDQSRIEAFPARRPP